MLTINFGKGTGGSGPYPAREEIVLNIPHSGELPSIENNVKSSEYASYKPRFKGESNSCVVIALPQDKLEEIGDWDRAIEVRIYWIEERNEWVAFHFCEYVEDVTGTDISVDGPFSIKDSDWSYKIAEAFGIQTIALSKKECIVQSSPRKLERFHVLKLISENCTDEVQVDRIRRIGKCTMCGEDSLYCCYKAYSGGMSCQDNFLHFCTKCYNYKYETKQQQEDLEAGLEAALCPFCEYDWSNAYKWNFI